VLIARTVWAGGLVLIARTVWAGGPVLIARTVHPVCSLIELICVKVNIIFNFSLFSLKNTLHHSMYKQTHIT
jgi:hypothetical protein